MDDGTAKVTPDWLIQVRIGSREELEDGIVRGYGRNPANDCGNGWRWWDAAREATVHEAIQRRDLQDAITEMRRVCNTWSYSWRIITSDGAILWSLAAEG